MVKVSINYEGRLRCTNTHLPSKSQFSTDAPVDNKGRGESFSPTDLIATALGSCMATIMGIVAQGKGINLEGMEIIVEKHMAEDLPRRVAQLKVRVEVPLPANHPERKVLECSALSCPVYQSIHPDIKVPIEWCWQDV